MDFKCLPPCKNVLMRKIARTHTLAKMIKHAHNQFIGSDLNDGWNIVDNKLTIDYYSGEPYPVDVSEILSRDIGESDDEADHFSDEDGDTDYSDDDEFIY